MKGHFSLRVHPETGFIHFGNLGLIRYDSEGFAVYDPISKANIESASRIIAHDVVEHAVSHRYKYHVTIEEELRALGAILFTRPFVDITTDLQFLMRYLSRPLKKAPLQNLPLEYDHSDTLETVLVSEGFGQDEEDEENLVELIKQAQLHIAFGYHAKALQFDHNEYRASSAFHFIERHSPDVIRAIRGDHLCTGASVYFDTDKHIFRFRMKRQWGVLHG